MSARSDNAPAIRDMDASVFSTILAELVVRVPGAHSAALVDAEGETVDYAGRGDPFELRIVAAHWRIVLADVWELRTLGSPRSFLVRGARRSYAIHALYGGYALVLTLGRRAGFAPSPRAVSACELALAREANWPLPTRRANWFAVAVACDERTRPVAILTPAHGHRIEILGRVIGGEHRHRERAFRVRLGSGVELTLVCESGNHWYADEALDCSSQGALRKTSTRGGQDS